MTIEQELEVIRNMVRINKKEQKQIKSTPCFLAGHYAVTNRSMPTASVTITLLRRDYDVLHELAKHKGLTKSALVREFVKKELESV